MKAAHSVREFCETHSIARTTFYELLKRGEGPTIMRVGSRTLISAEAAEAWRRRMEAAAAQPSRESGAK